MDHIVNSTSVQNPIIRLKNRPINNMGRKNRMCEIWGIQNGLPEKLEASAVEEEVKLGVKAGWTIGADAMTMATWWVVEVLMPEPEAMTTFK